jgi:hypothetical protein
VGDLWITRVFALFRLNSKEYKSELMPPPGQSEPGLVAGYITGWFDIDAGLLEPEME